MATSGVVAQATLQVERQLAIAFAQCGKPISTVSGELLSMARDLAQMELWALSNDGVNLWCMRKNVFRLDAGDSVVAMTRGTVDVINALSRTLTEPAHVSFSAVDYSGVQLTGGAAYIRNVSGVFQAAGDVSLVVECSDDGVAWSAISALNTATVSADASFSIDLDNSELKEWWRLRDVSGLLLAIDSLKFQTVSQEYPVSKFNRDEYQLLPDKSRLGPRPLQFWFDKQNDPPQLWVWPVPQDNSQQLVVWEQSLIEDIGDLFNELAVPRRWYLAAVAIIAASVASIIPPAELPPGRLQELINKRDYERERAQGGETDGSPSTLLPRISVYTR